MIAWWWLIPAVFAAFTVGLFTAALLAAAGSER